METFQRPELKLRDPAKRETDKAALQAIAQAAIDVELFTIPLYMVSMYSIQGMHQITSKGNDFYRGRLWSWLANSAHWAEIGGSVAGCSGLFRFVL